MNASSGYQKDTAWQCFASPCQRGSEGIDNERQAEEKMDDILVEGMSRLTFQELQQEQDDLHGVAEDSAEKAQEIQRLLDALGKRLSKIKAGTAYESAETMNQH